MGFGEKYKEETKQPNEFECCRRAQNFRITGKKENKLKIVSLQFLFSPPFSSHLKVQFNSRHNNFKWKIIKKKSIKSRAVVPRERASRRRHKKKKVKFPVVEQLFQFLPHCALLQAFNERFNYVELNKTDQLSFRACVGCSSVAWLSWFKFHLWKCVHYHFELKHLWSRACFQRGARRERENDMQLVCELLITFLHFFSSPPPPDSSHENTKTGPVMTRLLFCFNQSTETETTLVGAMAAKWKKENWKATEQQYWTCKLSWTHFSFNNDHLHDLFTFHTV